MYMYWYHLYITVPILGSNDTTLTLRNFAHENNNFKIQYLSGTKPMIYRGEPLAQVNFIPFIPINDDNIHGKLWWISGWRNYDFDNNHIYLVGMILYIPLYTTNKQVYFFGMVCRFL